MNKNNSLIYSTHSFSPSIACRQVKSYRKINPRRLLSIEKWLRTLRTSRSTKPLTSIALISITRKDQIQWNRRSCLQTPRSSPQTWRFLRRNQTLQLDKPCSTINLQLKRHQTSLWFLFICSSESGIKWTKDSIVSSNNNSWKFMTKLKSTERSWKNLLTFSVLRVLDTRMKVFEYICDMSKNFWA